MCEEASGDLVLAVFLYKWGRLYFVEQIMNIFVFLSAHEFALIRILVKAQREEDLMKPSSKW